eukprot:6823239-Alexandrium_andersonii.AAC.1
MRNKWHQQHVAHSASGRVASTGHLANTQSMWATEHMANIACDPHPPLWAIQLVAHSAFGRPSMWATQHVANLACRRRPPLRAIQIVAHAARGPS